ncbi:MAG: signal peptide peptidase SppA [Oligoflexales bacterium]
MNTSGHHSDSFRNSSGVVGVLARLIRWSRNYFILVGALVTFGIFFGLMMTPGKEKTLDDDAKVYLNLKLQGTLLDSSSDWRLIDEVFAQLLEKPAGPYLLDLKKGLEHAASDARVHGVFLEIQNLSGSLASFTELRSYIEAFKQSGKAVYAWMYAADNKTYYLASVADQLFLAPVGEVSIPGPSFELVYFGEALQKLGVEVEVVRAGKFKSAFEPFVLNEPSQASREMYLSMEKSLRSHLNEKITEGRKLEQSSKVTSWFKNGLFSARTALERKLVDGLTYVDQAKDQVFKPKELESYSFTDYTSQDLPKPSSSFKEKDGIALIEAYGEIHLSQQGSEQVITPKNLGKKISWAMNQDQVKGVVLRISSPGGSATASDIIWEQVRQLAEKKPVVVSMGGVAASGGYYIAAPAQKIFADPTTITGSIGVIGMVPNFRNFQEKYGVSFHMVSNSERRSLLNPGERASAKDREVLGQSIDEVYEVFINKVAQGRKLAVEEVNKIAQGRVWTGLQAKNIGLVDEMGGLWEAIQEAKKLAKLDPATKYPLLKWQPEMSTLSECLLNYRSCFPLSMSKNQNLFLSSTLNPLMVAEKLSHWRRYVNDEPIQAIWPGSQP